MNNPSIKKILFTNFIVYVISLLASLITLSAATKIDIIVILNDFWQTQCLITKNTVILQTNSKINFLAPHYSAIFFSFLFLPLIIKVSNNHRLTKELLSKYLRIQVITTLTVLIFAQTVIHIKFVKPAMEIFYHKTIVEKISYTYEKSYEFAQYCKEHLPGKHICQPVTDLDRTSPRELLTYLAVQYYLYPLDIVTYRAHTDFDCIVIFQKTNPESHVPSSFIGSPLFDARNLLAIKKDIINHDL